MARFALPLATAAVVALVGTGFASGASATPSKICEQITVTAGGKTHRYGIIIAQGVMTCNTARRVLGLYLAKKPVPSGWVCSRGKKKGEPAATCGRHPGGIAHAFRFRQSP